MFYKYRSLFCGAMLKCIVLMFNYYTPSDCLANKYAYNAITFQEPDAILSKIYNFHL